VHRILLPGSRVQIDSSRSSSLAPTAFSHNGQHVTFLVGCETQRNPNLARSSPSTRQALRTQERRSAAPALRLYAASQHATWHTTPHGHILPSARQRLCRRAPWTPSEPPPNKLGSLLAKCATSYAAGHANIHHASRHQRPRTANSSRVQCFRRGRHRSRPRFGNAARSDLAISDVQLPPKHSSQLLARRACTIKTHTVIRVRAPA